MLHRLVGQHQRGVAWAPEAAVVVAVLLRLTAGPQLSCTTTQESACVPDETSITPYLSALRGQFAQKCLFAQLGFA
jgi:hypothetical protein